MKKYGTPAYHRLVVSQYEATVAQLKEGRGKYTNKLHAHGPEDWQRKARDCGWCGNIISWGHSVRRQEEHLRHAVQIERFVHVSIANGAKRAYVMERAREMGAKVSSVNAMIKEGRRA